MLLASPCEKLIRKQSAPARISARTISSEDDAGPSVAMILVYLWAGMDVRPGYLLPQGPGEDADGPALRPSRGANEADTPCRSTAAPRSASSRRRAAVQSQPTGRGRACASRS